MTEIIILSLFFLNHWHSYIAVHFIEMFFFIICSNNISVLFVVIISVYYLCQGVIIEK